MTIMKHVFLVVLLINGVFGAIKLESFNVDPESVTISGLSAGGAMVQQFHFAFSSDVKAAGVFAGLPYACAKGGLTAATMCMSSPGLTNVPNLVGEINTQATAGKLDDPSNVSGQKIYVFHGTKDTTVDQRNGEQVQEIYEDFGAVAKTDYDFAASHGFPTDFYGAACGSSSALTQYINNCDYNAAYEMLQYFYGDLINPADIRNLHVQPIQTFDQEEFFAGSTPGKVSMDPEGYVYIPSGCVDRKSKCKFHISFHGCLQYKGLIGDKYATKTGFLEVAEANNIIVLFPQADASFMIGNPNGCWDWWGYLNSNFINKDGAQMAAVHKMLRRVVHCDGNTPCFETEEPTTTYRPTSTGPTAHPTTGAPGECAPNEISFKPFPGNCELYLVCACGVQVLRQCAAGLYFDPAISECNFIQIVDCQQA